MQIFYKIVALLTLAILASCTTPKKTYNTEARPTQLRIVDLQGHPHPVKMRTPELNVQALAAQGNLDEERMASIEPPANGNIQEAAKNKYATDNPPLSSNYPGTSEEALQQTLQTPQAEQEVPAQTEIIASNNVKKNKNEVIEYDLATDANDKSVKTKHKAAVSQSSAVKRRGIFVQAGSFSVMQHAQNSVGKVKKLSGSSAVSIEEVMLNDKMVYRVMIGPFASKPKAESMVHKLAKSGHQAIIVRSK